MHRLSCLTRVQVRMRLRWTCCVVHDVGHDYCAGRLHLQPHVDSICVAGYLLFRFMLQCSVSRKAEIHFFPGAVHTVESGRCVCGLRRMLGLLPAHAGSTAAASAARWEWELALSRAQRLCCGRFDCKYILV